MALARELGADVAINYRQKSVEEMVTEYTDGKGFDVVFDTVGDDNIQNALKAVAINGKVVSILSLSSQDLTLGFLKGVDIHLVFMLIPMLHGVGKVRHGEILRELAEIVDAGKIRPLYRSEIFPIFRSCSSTRIF